MTAEADARISQCAAAETLKQVSPRKRQSAAHGAARVRGAVARGGLGHPAAVAERCQRRAGLLLLLLVLLQQLVQASGEGA